MFVIFQSDYQCLTHPLYLLQFIKHITDTELMTVLGNICIEYWTLSRMIVDASIYRVMRNVLQCWYIRVQRIIFTSMDSSKTFQIVSVWLFFCDIHEEFKISNTALPSFRVGVKVSYVLVLFLSCLILRKYGKMYIIYYLWKNKYYNRCIWNKQFISCNNKLTF